MCQGIPPIYFKTILFMFYMFYGKLAASNDTVTLTEMSKDVKFYPISEDVQNTLSKHQILFASKNKGWWYWLSMHHIRKMRSEHKILARKPEGNRPLVILRHQLENIKSEMK
jgi:hypothetical protein